MARCRNILPPNIKLNIYHASFQSRLNYCHLVWATTTKTNLNNILLLQKKILRYIGDVSYYDHTEPLFSRFHILHIESMYEYRLLYTVRFSSPALVEFLYAISHLRRHECVVNTRHTVSWVLPRSRTNYNFQSLHYNIPLLLNICINNNININTISKRALRLCFSSIV